MNKLKQIGIFVFFLVYEEIIFEVLTIPNTENLVLKFIFLILSALIFDTIVIFFKEKHRKVPFLVLTIGISVIYIVYYLYYKIFQNVLSLYSVMHGTQAVQFTDVIVGRIIENWYAILLLALPIIAFIVFRKKIDFHKINKELLVNAIAIVIIYAVSLGCIAVTSNENDISSNKNLYYNINNPNSNLKTFGLLPSIRLDLWRSITGFEEEQLYIYENENGEKKVINSEEYNVLDIDFNNLIENEEDKTINEISEYLSKQEPSKKNEYTGMFKGKNLVVVVAESFSQLAIREDLTPTLYKMYHQGFEFKNFYTPLFPVSTADGEYLTDTSLVPAEGTWSIETVAGNYIPYSYANVLKKEGYKTFAYHNYDYTYYNRDKYLETMGYETYLGGGNGLENRMNLKENPSSDYEMVKTTIDDYINEEHFLAYYMTMSGHMDYNKTNAMVVKNWDLVKDLPYSDKAKSYLATQIELDRAMEELINRLEKVGKLDDTVIIITGDHYPYGLTLDEMNEISTFERDRVFEKFRMPFVLYNSTVKENIEIEKYAFSLDVLPTMLNLFGVKFDSRLLMGRDILSDAEPLIIFSDRSYIEADGRYDSNSEIYIANNDGEEKTEEEIAKTKKEIYHKYRYSRLMLQNDYYRKLKENGILE